MEFVSLNYYKQHEKHPEGTVSFRVIISMGLNGSDYDILY
jgi:hypothetical protein